MSPFRTGEGLTDIPSGGISVFCSRFTLPECGDGHDEVVWAQAAHCAAPPICYHYRKAVLACVLLCSEIPFDSTCKLAPTVPKGWRDGSFHLHQCSCCPFPGIH